MKKAIYQMFNYLQSGMLTWDAYEGADNYHFSIGPGGGSTEGHTYVDLKYYSELWEIEPGANYSIRAIVEYDGMECDLTNDYIGTYPSLTVGDLDDDGDITILDVRLLLQAYINSSASTEWTTQQLSTMDMNSDGKIDILDVRLLLQAYINS